MKTIELMNISKNYGKTQALKNIHLTFEKGKIYGLLGRNGAGKSTLLRTITKRIQCNSGEVSYDGKNKLSDYESTNVYMTEPDSLIPEEYRLKEVFDYTKILLADFDYSKAMDAAREFNLHLKKKVKSLSTGNMSILRSILALYSGADFIFLDEPTLGFDVVNREIFYRRLLEVFNEKQSSIILSTHLILEVEPLLEKVIFIDKGEISLEKDMEDIQAKYFFITGPEREVMELGKNYKILRKMHRAGFLSLVVEGNISEMPEDGVIPGVSIRPVNLQELFIALNQNSQEVF